MISDFIIGESGASQGRVRGESGASQGRVSAESALSFVVRPHRPAYVPTLRETAPWRMERSGARRERSRAGKEAASSDGGAHAHFPGWRAMHAACYGAIGAATLIS